MKENDPTQNNTNQPGEFEFFRIGELQRSYQEKYARGVGSVALTEAEIESEG